MDHREVQLMEYEERWAKTEFVVEASHEETFQIWKEWHKEVGFEQCSGCSIQICNLWVTPLSQPMPSDLKVLPLVVAISWQLVDGHLVAFYYACSMVVHHEMVREYINSMTPKGVEHTNASNFSHVIGGLKIVPRSTA